MSQPRQTCLSSRLRNNKDPQGSFFCISYGHWPADAAEFKLPDSSSQLITALTEAYSREFREIREIREISEIKVTNFSLYRLSGKSCTVRFSVKSCTARFSVKGYTARFSVKSCTARFSVKGCTARFSVKRG